LKRRRAHLKERTHGRKRRLLRAEAHQRTMAERDPLTGVCNRRAFDVSLDRAITRCAPERPEGPVAAAQAVGV
jgi:GGDEF domain-containing protein